VAFSPDGTSLTSAGIAPGVCLWDARSLTPAVNAEVKAVGLLDLLFSKPLPQSEVRAAIGRDKLMSEAARQKALELADRFHEETDPKRYHDAAWPMIRHPYANVFMGQFALAQMNAACERAPDNASYHSALGVAQYRLGRFQKERYPEARATLSRCDPSHPLTLAFLAMTQHQLGEKDQARTTLARLRDVLKVPREAANDDAEAWLREAVELIEDRPAQTKRGHAGLFLKAIQHGPVSRSAAHRGDVSGPDAA
jgi:tetratricopeptide (TPR) repeat protein